MLSRREFLAASMLIAVTPRTNLAESSGRLPIVQGPTDDRNVQFAVLSDFREPLRFFLRFKRTGQVVSANQIVQFDRPFSSWIVSHVRFSGMPSLEPAELLIESMGGKLIDVRPFRWLDPRRESFRVALLSCAAGYLYDQQMWLRLNSQNVDAVIWLGDNLYADRPNLITKRPANEVQLWEQYVAARNRYDFFRRPELVPSFATWDDHDYGLDNGDRHYAFRDASKATFEAFWPQQQVGSLAIERGPGVATRWQALGFDWLSLDDRYFRDHSRSNRNTAFGDDQLDWATDKIRRGDRPLVLMNGQQFYGGYRGKNTIDFEYPVDFEFLVAHLRAAARPTVLLSGDVHFSEVMYIEHQQLGIPAAEITASSMHSITFPGQHNWNSNPRRRAATSSHNFVVLELRRDGGEISGTATSIGVDGRALFREALAIR